MNGKVIFIGAGPGDPGLITVKAAKYLQQADVILTDRLVSEEILFDHARTDAEIIHVGKQCRKRNSTSQKTINEMLVDYATEGKFVVRLKGGDVSIFSNILDEFASLVANNISYEVVPGVTASLGAAAYAGIPLTARGYSTGVRFLTYYRSDIVSDKYWEELAATDDTLVFYMSSETIGYVADILKNNNIAEEKLIAVIEQATTPLQRISVFNIYDANSEIKNMSFISPSLVIIGKVVQLHQQFKWLENSNTNEYYFEPINNTEDNFKTTHVNAI